MNSSKKEANLEELRDRESNDTGLFVLLFSTFNIGCHNLLITLLHGTRSSKKGPDCQVFLRLKRLHCTGPALGQYSRLVE